MCFTADTTVLTVDGWKGYKSLSTKDPVATFNRFNGKIVYQCPTDKRIVHNYEGELIQIKSRDTNQLFTPDHQILLLKPYERNGNHLWDSNWSFERAGYALKIIKAKGYVKLPLAGKYKQGTLSIGNYYAELLGWILTDGHFVPKCSGIRIFQSSVNAKKVDRIRFLLDQLNVKYTESKKEYNPKDTFDYCKDQINPKYSFYPNASGFTVRIRKNIPHKQPTWKLLQLQPSELISLFKGLLGGDSDLYAKSNRQKNGKLRNSCHFVQKNSDFRAWIQALCSLIGCRSKEHLSRSQVAICGRDTLGITKYKMNIKKTMNPIKMWGVETKNQTIICRRTVVEKNTKGEKVRKTYVFITSGVVN